MARDTDVFISGKNVHKTMKSSEDMCGNMCRMCQDRNYHLVASRLIMFVTLSDLQANSDIIRFDFYRIIIAFLM